MKENFKKKILRNGMTILFEKRNLPIVSVAFAVRNGGMNESSDEKGISHFIEHMAFKGTPTKTSKQIAEKIEKNGGVLNAFTDEVITSFVCKIPSNHLNIALDVLGDIVKNPLFDQEEIDKERKVIFEEIKMRKDTPRIHVFDKIQSFLYEKPLGEDLIGTYDTMNSITREKLVERFNGVFQPDNMILCVVGDADFDEIVSFAEKNFVSGNGKNKKFEIKTKNQSKIEKRKGIDQANLVLAHHTPLGEDKKTYAAVALSTILGGGMSSRLFTEIREKRNLAYSIHGGEARTKEYAYNYIYVGTQKENVEKVKKLILEEFEKVSKDLSEEELNQVKDQLIGNHQIGMEDSQDQMVGLMYCELIGDAEDVYNFEENIRNVKLKDVKELASKVKGKDYSFFALVPED
jgi:predicted Zn-dependent peptidase